MPQDRQPAANISLDEFEERTARSFGIPRGLREALKAQESGGRDSAVSYKGARGRFQVMPDTVRKYDLNPADDFDQTYTGLRYLKEKFDEVDESITDPVARWAAALAGYHGGERQIRHINRFGGRIATGSDGLTTTDQYVDSIMSRWQQSSRPTAPVVPSAAPEPRPLRKTIAPGRQRTTVRGPVLTQPAVNPFDFKQPSGLQATAQQVAARTSLVSPEVSAEADRRGREMARFQGRSRLGQIGEVAAGGLMRGVDQLVKAASYINPNPMQPRGYGALKPASLANLQAQEAAQDVVLPNTAPIVRGTASAVPQIAAVGLTGPAAPLTAAGIQAANEDWRDPKRAALRTAISAVGGYGGGRLAQRLIAPQTMAGRVASGATGGALGNIIPSAVEQVAYDGRLNPQQLAQQAAIGAITGVATPPGVEPRAMRQTRGARPATEPTFPYDENGNPVMDVNAPLTPELVGQGINRAGNLGATVQRPGDLRARRGQTAPMPIQNRLQALADAERAPLALSRMEETAPLTQPFSDAPATQLMPPAPPQSPLTILQENANEAKINAAQFEQAGDWESARREYDVAHKALVDAQRQMGRPKTAEDADALTAIRREISAAAANRDKARREMLKAERMPARSGGVRATPRQVAEDAPTSDLPAETSPLLRSVVNPEGGVPVAEESASGVFGQLARRQAAARAKPQRGPKDSGQLSAAEYLKRATDGEGVRVSDRGEARVLGAKEAGIVGLVNKNSRFGPNDAQVMLDEGGFTLPDGRRFTDPSVTENDVLAFLADQGREGQMNTRDLDAQLEREMANYYESPPSEPLPSSIDVPAGNVPRGIVPPSARLPRPQTVREQAEQFRSEIDPEDLTALDAALGRYEKDQPRPYGERTRPGEPGTALSYSPYSDLVTNNRDAIQQLEGMNLDSPEAGEILARVDDFAERRGIESRHVENLVNYLKNEQLERARMADEGVPTAALRPVQSSELRDFYSRPDATPPPSEPLRPVERRQPVQARRPGPEAVEPPARAEEGPRADQSDALATTLSRIQQMSPDEVEQTLRDAEARRNADIRKPEMSENEIRLNRQVIELANERRREMVRAKQLPPKFEKRPPRGVANPFDADPAALSDEMLAQRIQDAERILDSPDVSEARAQRIEDFLTVAEREQQRRQNQMLTVSHPDPTINGKPIVGKTADGRVIVANPANKGGVSVVKLDRMTEDLPTLTSARNYFGTPPVARRPETPEDGRAIVGNVRSEFRQRKDAPGTLFTNEQGTIVIASAARQAGIPFAVEGRFEGARIRNDDASVIADALGEKAAAYGRQGKTLSAIARDLREAVANAKANGANGIVVADATVAGLTGKKQLLREERFHQFQGDRGLYTRTVATAVEAALKGELAYQRIRQGLLGQGYQNDPAILISEASAKIASGQWKEYGLQSEKQGIDFLEKYFEVSARVAGSQAVEMVAPGTAAARKAQIDVREKFRAARPGPGLGRGERGQEIGETPASVAGRRPGSPGSGIRPPQSPTASLRAITPESLRASGDTAPPSEPGRAQSGNRKGLGAISAETLRAQPDIPVPRPAPESRFSKTFGILSDLYHAPKSLLSSADISAAGRQGLFLSLPPSQWGRAARAMGRQFRSLVSTLAYDRFVSELRGHRDYETAKESGLYLATDHTSSGINGREEGFASRLIGKLPHVKYSEQAYKTYLDSIRMDTFEKYRALIERQPGSTEQKTAAMKAAADWINTSSGRGRVHGKFGESVEQATPLLNTIFFAPRYTISRFQMINPATYARNLQSPEHRVVFRQQVGEIFQAAAALTLTSALAKAAGADISLDPDEADFLKLKFGNTRYDVLAGTQQAARLAVRIGKWLKAEGLEENEKKLSAKRGETAEAVRRFGRTKLGPVPSFFVDWLNNWKNIVGERHTPSEVSVKNPIVQRVLPFLWSDVLDAYMQGYRGGGGGAQGAKAAAKYAPGIAGIGVQDYDRRKPKRAPLQRPPSP